MEAAARQHVLPHHALVLRADAGDRAPRLLVARVRLQLDAHAAQRLEAVGEQEQASPRC